MGGVGDSQWDACGRDAAGDLLYCMVGERAAVKALRWAVVIRLPAGVVDFARADCQLGGWASVIQHRNSSASMAIDKELNMATASIEVSGPDAERLARDLRASLTAGAEPGDSVSPVEVERSPELVIAIIGLAFSAVSTAKTI